MLSYDRALHDTHFRYYLYSVCSRVLRLVPYQIENKDSAYNYLLKKLSEYLNEGAYDSMSNTALDEQVIPLSIAILNAYKLYELDNKEAFNENP